MSVWQRAVKRTIDLVVAFAGLVVLSPLFVSIAVAIKLDSPGPVFFRSLRFGRGFSPFTMYKFRSMVTDAQARSDVVSTPNDDPRITSVGRVLRRLNLDELPQLFNVLKGEMSLVGPRPEVQQYVALYTEEQRTILSIRPGITDWATVWIRDKGHLLAGSDDPERVYMERIRPKKLELQLEYVRSGSLWWDFRILARTIIICAERVPLLGRLPGVRHAIDSGPPTQSGPTQRLDA